MDKEENKIASFQIPRSFLKQIHRSQKKILQNALGEVAKRYRLRCENFFSKIPPSAPPEAREGAELYLKEVWWRDYEPHDRALQIELIKFERYIEEKSKEDIVGFCNLILDMEKKAAEQNPTQNNHEQ